MPSPQAASKALHIAAWHGQKQVVVELLDRNADVNVRDNVCAHKPASVVRLCSILPSSARSGGTRVICALACSLAAEWSHAAAQCGYGRPCGVIHA